MRAFLVTASLSFSFCLGWFFPAPPLKSRSLAQLDSSSPSYLSYEEIPCPSDDEIAEFRKTTVWTGAPETVSCETPGWGQVVRLHKLAQRLSVRLPAHWGAYNQEIFENTLSFISQTTGELVISDENPNAIASNFLGKRIILGPTLFKLPPLKALEILVHENRHSSLLDPRHVRCRTGDIAMMEGGCDEEFSKGIRTGAYSIGVLWSLAQSDFNENLSREDRQFLLNSAISQLTTRFNKVPESLAVPLDQLFVLSQDHQVFQIHPFTFEAIPLALPVESGDRIERIQYDPLESGFLAFTLNGKILQMTHHLKPGDYYSDVLPESIHWVDSNKVYTASSGKTPAYFVSENGVIFQKEFGRDRLTVAYKSLPFLTKKIFGALHFNLLMLTFDGQLYQAYTGGKGPHSGRPSLFEPAKNKLWVDASGGVDYEDLYAVDADLGHLFELRRANHRPGAVLEKSDFRTPEKMIKFQEAMNLRVALTEAGSLYAWDLLRSSEAPWKLPLHLEVKDFAVGRSVALPPKENPQKLSAWSVKCDVPLAFRDPWTQRQMGINRKKELVFEGAESSCVGRGHYYRHLKNEIHWSGDGSGALTNYFPQTYLLFQNLSGETFKVYPYRPPVMQY